MLIPNFDNYTGLSKRIFLFSGNNSEVFRNKRRKIKIIPATYPQRI
jgi:hypothetical protein